MPIQRTKTMKNLESIPTAIELCTRDYSIVSFSADNGRRERHDGDPHTGYDVYTDVPVHHADHRGLVCHRNKASFAEEEAGTTLITCILLAGIRHAVISCCYILHRIRRPRT